MSKNNVSAKSEIARLHNLCALLFSNKTAINRYKFGIYSPKLKRFEYLHEQKNFGSEYKALKKEIATLV